MKTRPPLWALALGALTLTSACGGATPEPAIAPNQLEFGVQMARRGLWNEALFRFRQAERHAPQNPRVINNIAVAHEALGQFDQALDYYQRAVKAAPSNAELRRNYSRFVEFYRNFKPDPEGTPVAGGDSQDQERPRPSS